MSIDFSALNGAPLERAESHLHAWFPAGRVVGREFKHGTFGGNNLPESECGQLEQDPDIVLLLHQAEFYDPNDQPDLAEVIIAKQVVADAIAARLRTKPLPSLIERGATGEGER